VEACNNVVDVRVGGYRADIAAGDDSREWREAN